MTPPTPPAYDLSENSVIWLAHLVVFSNALARCQRQRAVALWLALVPCGEANTSRVCLPTLYTGHISGQIRFFYSVWLPPSPSPVSTLAVTFASECPLPVKLFL